MTQLRYTRNLFLRGICVVYLFAFLSFYIQIPGLYGNNGILPAKLQLESVSSKSLSARIQTKPTMLWLAPYIGLDTEYMMDVLALMGAFLAFTGFISQKFCTVPTFAGLWSLYFSLYQVGQTFSWYQWDGLLLEAGVLAIVVAPLVPQTRSRRFASFKYDSPSDLITLWLVRWLLFRVLFSTGVVKLLSNCPKWWDLTALSIHFESMVLPTPLAWYCHHLPLWYLKLVMIYTQVSEIVMPFLFFIPVRQVRITAFLNQLFLQLHIIITGNFNFYNFLMITLMISLLDDKFFFKKVKKSKVSKTRNLLGHIVNILIHAGILYATYVLYNISFDGSKIDGKIAFTKDEFERAINLAIPVAVIAALVSLIITMLQALMSHVDLATFRMKSIASISITAFYAVIAGSILFITTVPLLILHPSTNSTVDPYVRHVYEKVEPYKIANSYGLFRRVTGVNGRPEIILEGSNSIEGPWSEYSFLYKPSNINNSLPFVAPYSPRLDWQMWFAALGTYNQQPWLMSLAYRLLTGQPEVLRLIDVAHSPFPKQPPKYIRATLYHYHYTPWNQRWQPTWWVREKVSEYFPIFSKDHGPLVDYLRSVRILPEGGMKVESKVNPIVKQILDYLRYLTAQMEGSFFLWSIFSAGCALIITISGRK